MLVDILSVQIFQIEVFIKKYIDFQNHSKKNGLPWMLAKGQDNFSTISQFIEKDIDPYSVDLQISVNGTVRQQDSAGKMHFKIDQLIAYISKYISLGEGDLIFTGTPDGVGPVRHGDKVLATGKIKDKLISKL